MMAINFGVKRKREDEASEDGYMSDESAFYGDEAAKAELEARASTFSVHEWWENKGPSLIEIARENLNTTSRPTPVTLYNPYEGQYANCARQLGETVAEFLERLPPETTRHSQSIPWIYVANPFRQPKVESEKVVGFEDANPEGEDSNWGEFLRRAGRLLEELTYARHQLEKENAGKVRATITRKLGPKKDMIVERIVKTAVELKVTSGKWMIFCDAEEVNEYWARIAHGTCKDELGTAAKVAPDHGEDRQQRLICVYTKDFTDMADVKRVVTKLRDYGMIGARGIYYKCDAYTYLRLGSGNEYNIKASMYSSAEVLKAGKGRDGKVEGFFASRKKDERDWRALANE